MDVVDSHADCRYWGLTTEQCFRYHLRLARYYINQANRFIEKSKKASDQARRATKWSFWALGLSVGLMIVGVVFG